MAAIAGVAFVVIAHMTGHAAGVVVTIQYKILVVVVMLPVGYMTLNRAGLER